MNSSPLEAATDKSWRKDAKCLVNEMSHEFFFQHDCTEKCKHKIRSTGKCGMRNRSAQQSLDEMRNYCEGCPVLAACRSWAVITAYPYGFAGGMTHAERVTIRRTLRKSGINLKQTEEDG